MKRCFLAVELPESIRKMLITKQTAICQILQKEGIAVKWVEPQNLHITIKFFGDLSNEQITIIKDFLEEGVARISTGKLMPAGLGAFPGFSNPKVLWIGINDDKKVLTELHDLAEKAAFKAGIEPDKKRYVPHLTLGRVKYGGLSKAGYKALESFTRIKENGRNHNQGEQKENNSIDIGGTDEIFDAGEIKLMESKLFPGGPVYKHLAVFHLMPH